MFDEVLVYLDGSSLAETILSETRLGFPGKRIRAAHGIDAQSEVRHGDSADAICRYLKDTFIMPYDPSCAMTKETHK